LIQILKYTHILHGERPIKEQCIRVFASRQASDPGIQKVHAKSGKPAKIANSPSHCFIYNENISGITVPSKLDKEWYVELARKRLAGFGVIWWEHLIIIKQKRG